MFENILGLDRVCDDLRRDITAGRLPGAILLSGPRYGAKSSIALEVARVVSCRQEGAWDCSCHSCRMHRTLQHPDTVLVGPRYFSLEVRAAGAAFLQVLRPGTAYLLIRSVRKLTRRFDVDLWPDAKLKKALPIVEALETALTELEETVLPQFAAGSGNASAPGAAVARLVKKIETDVPRLEQLLPHDPVPVDLVRTIWSWAHLSSSRGQRVVILEEAHTLQDAARNAMLKLLEEPPENTLFILTSTRRSAIIPTVRSRVRAYEVGERPKEVQREVQRRIFRSDAPEDTLRDFFRQQSASDGLDWQDLGRRLVDALATQQATHQIELELRDMIGAVSPRHGAEYFLEALEEEIGYRLRRADAAPDIPRETLFRWAPIIHRYWGRIESRNMNPAAVVSALILAFRTAMERP
ncbi:MAG: hypothetical protein PF508_10890 [Spirochaeta sp.]|jgi:DNA polymerase-3 subunit delta'|nr:hypothetical protein [Spirochaeta sp.]